MTSKTWYKEWFNSPFYHKLYFERDEQEASAFISRLIHYLKPAPKSRMLDVGCGKGRHSRKLADMGYIVTGIDISEDSIIWARQFENDHLEFFMHDMRLPFLINFYHYAFNLFTSFGYFNTRREHDDTLRTISNSLLPGGRLIIDYLNVHYSEARFVHHEEKQIGQTSYTIYRWDDEDHFFKKITISDPSLEEPVEHTEKVAKFMLGDFNDMLSFHGLSLKEVFGDYQLGPYDIQKAPRMIIIAEKKNAFSENKMNGK